MPTNNGTYTLPSVYEAIPGTIIRADQHNAPLEDLAVAMNGTIPRDGSRAMQADLPMAGRKITGLGNGVNDSDAATVSQVNSSSLASQEAVSDLDSKLMSLVSQVTAWVNQSVPVGRISWHNGAQSTITSGEVMANGQFLTRSVHPELWEFAQANGVISDAAWLANPDQRVKYSSGDGSTTFRMPDLNGVQSGSLSGLHLRGSGAGTVQTAHSDAIRNITGSAGPVHAQTVGGGGTGTGAMRGTPSGGGGANSGGGSGTLVTFDASLQVPTAGENRPKSAIGIWIIRSTPFKFTEPT